MINGDPLPGHGAVMAGAEDLGDGWEELGEADEATPLMLSALRAQASLPRLVARAKQTITASLLCAALMAALIAAQMRFMSSDLVEWKSVAFSFAWQLSGCLLALGGGVWYTLVTHVDHRDWKRSVLVTAPHASGLLVVAGFMLAGTVGLAAMWFWADGGWAVRRYLWLALVGAAFATAVATSLATFRLADLQTRHPTVAALGRIQKYGACVLTSGLMTIFLLSPNLFLDIHPGDEGPEHYYWVALAVSGAASSVVGGLTIAYARIPSSTSEQLLWQALGSLSFGFSLSCLLNLVTLLVAALVAKDVAFGCDDGKVAPDPDEECRRQRNLLPLVVTFLQPAFMAFFCAMVGLRASVACGVLRSKVIALAARKVIAELNEDSRSTSSLPFVNRAPSGSFSSPHSRRASLPQLSQLGPQQLSAVFDHVVPGSGQRIGAEQIDGAMLEAMFACAEGESPEARVELVLAEVTGRPDLTPFEVARLRSVIARHLFEGSSN